MRLLRFKEGEAQEAGLCRSLYLSANTFAGVCGAPENVNDNPNTAPSKRLVQIYPGYQKVLFGVLVAEAIGIDDIRKKCPHFDEGIAKPEHLTPFS